MDRETLYALLSSVGLPLCYKTWLPDDAPPPPRMCYRYMNNDADLKADNVNFVRVSEWALELYTKAKDDEVEAAIERLFMENEIVFSKTEAEISSEGLYEVLYLFSTI